VIKIWDKKDASTMLYSYNMLINSSPFFSFLLQLSPPTINKEEEKGISK